MAIADEETSSPPLKSQIEGVFEDKIDSEQRLPIKEKAIFLFFFNYVLLSFKFSPLMQKFVNFVFKHDIRQEN